MIKCKHKGDTVMNQIGNNLRRYRQLNNYSLLYFDQKLSLSATAVQKYENNEIMLDSNRLIQFADLYNIKVLNLLQEYNLPTIQFSNFRKKSKLVGHKLETLKEVMRVEIAKYIEVLSLYHHRIIYNKNESQSVCNSLEEAERKAVEFRNKYQISSKLPLLGLTSLLENIGFLIIYIDSQNQFDGFDGLSEFIDDIPVIVLLKGKNGVRQRFTLAHELGHLLLSFNEELPLEEKERYCNRFASSLLMPKDAIENEFGKNRTGIRIPEYVNFMKEYQVSVPAVIYRLRELGVINQNCAKLSYMNWNNKKKNEEDKIPCEESYHFQSLVYKLESQGIISYNKACEYLGDHANDYSNGYCLN